MNELVYYYVWNENGNRPRYQHSDRKSAIVEAERLAGLCEGERFYVMKVEGVAVKPKPTGVFKEFDEDEIPF